jgi:hypothetical protein
MATSEELNRVFREAASVAEELLRRSTDDLIPQMGVLKKDGSITVVACPETKATVGTDPRARLRTLAREILESADTVVAVAVVFDIRMRMTPSASPIDALLIEVHAPEGPRGSFVRNYKRGHGNILFERWARLAERERPTEG